MVKVKRGSTIASFIKAVSGIAMAGKDDHLMATVLKAYGGVDNQSFCAANSQVGMEKDYCLFIFLVDARRHLNM